MTKGNNRMMGRNKVRMMELRLEVRILAWAFSRVISSTNPCEQAIDFSRCAKHADLFFVRVNLVVVVAREDYDFYSILSVCQDTGATGRK